MTKTKQTNLLLLGLLGVLAIIAGCPTPGLDTIAPTVSLTAPVDEATDVAINTGIRATFSEPMDPLTLTPTSFTLTDGTTAVTGTVTYTGRVATFTPAASLVVSTTYTATITTVAADIAGNGLAANQVWSFTTGTAADTTAPTVASTIPADAASGVAVNSNITATFSEAMDPATIIAANFALAAGIVPVTGTVTYDLPSLTATFAPTDNLAPGTTYTATITTAVTDVTGNALAADETWIFATATAGLGPAPVPLGTAGNYAILAKTGVSTAPSSAITGDVGLSPAAESYLTGFSQTDATGYATSDQVVSGFLYAATMAEPTPTNLTTAVANMLTAYTDAAGRTLPDSTNLLSGNIGGQTLTPGLYNWGSTVNIASSITITGATNDVWIFQITDNLTVGNGVIIILGGGAQAKNIFWQVAGQVTLGTTSQFHGIILCQTAIDIQTGATLNGRALAQTAVTLDQATVTEPIN